jgi:hypothetical protein
MSKARLKKWRKLTDEQIQGADWILRVIYTSPAIRGEGRRDVEMLHAELRDECDRRAAAEAKQKRMVRS